MGGGGGGSGVGDVDGGGGVGGGGGVEVWVVWVVGAAGMHRRPLNTLILLLLRNYKQVVVGAVRVAEW